MTLCQEIVLLLNLINMIDRTLSKNFLYFALILLGWGFAIISPNEAIAQSCRNTYVCQEPVCDSSGSNCQCTGGGPRTNYSCLPLNQAACGNSTPNCLGTSDVCAASNCCWDAEGDGNCTIDNPPATSNPTPSTLCGGFAEVGSCHHNSAGDGCWYICQSDGSWSGAYGSNCSGSCSNPGDGPGDDPGDDPIWRGCINNTCSSTTWGSRDACEDAGATNCQANTCPVCPTYQKSCTITATSSGGAATNSNGVINISNTETLTISGAAFSNVPYAEPSNLLVYKQHPTNPQNTVTISPAIPNTTYQSIPSIPNYYLFNTGLQLPNNSFESGTTTGWDPNEVTNFGVTSNRSYPNNAPGSYSLVGLRQPGAYDPYIASGLIQTGQPLGGRSFTLRFAIASHSTADTISNISLQAYPSWHQASIGTINVNANWRIIERTVTFPANIQDTQMRVVLRQPASQQVYYDNVEIRLPNTGYNCSTGYGSSCTGTAQISNLTPGTYKFWCDMPYPSSYPQPCSGNPVCSVNGGHLACGWPSCSNNDLITVNVTCTPNCGTNQCGQSNGCGGFCTDGRGRPGVRLDITDPSRDTNNNVLLTTADDYVTISWSDISTQPRAEQYVLAVYPRRLHPASGDLNAFCSNATNRRYCRTFNTAGFIEYRPGTRIGEGATGLDQDYLYNVAVKSINNSCSTEIGESNWLIQPVNFTGTVSGNFYLLNNPAAACTGTGNGLINPGGNVTVSNSTYSTTTNGSMNINGTSYQANNVPYASSRYTNRNMSAQLTLPEIDPTAEYTYACAACNASGSGPSFTCVNSNLLTSPGTANFYVRRYNTSTDPWWQVANGLFFAQDGFGSNRVPDNTLCNSGNDCTPFIGIAAAGTLNHFTAGIPISGVGINPSNRTSQRQDGTGTPERMARNIVNKAPLESYETLSTLYDLTSITSISATDLNSLNNLTSLPSSNYLSSVDSRNKEVRVYFKNGDLTISPNSSQRWVVPNDKKYLVFVSGNLTIRDDDTNNEPRLISVTEGGFLGFIVRENITIEPSVGHRVTEGSTPPTQPNLEGVYLADNITIAADSNSNTSERKFVGAGTFVGIQGINLHRDFHDGVVGRALHNTNPTELFTYRPDFLINAPESLLQSDITWRVTND